MPQSADAKLSTGDKAGPGFYQETVEAQAQKGHGSGRFPAPLVRNHKCLDAGANQGG
jgi:hypothetical protein